MFHWFVVLISRYKIIISQCYAAVFMNPLAFYFSCANILITNSSVILKSNTTRFPQARQYPVAGGQVQLGSDAALAAIANS
jgi:hypothetical protein